MNSGTGAADERRTFTSEKLDWLVALSGDPRLDARSVEVGFCIVQHVNAKSGLAILSDDTIRDKTGIPKRWVQRARKKLREADWINWRRTRSANVYWTLPTRVNIVTDYLLILREQRKERQAQIKKAQQEAPPAAYLRNQEMPPVTE